MLRRLRAFVRLSRLTFLGGGVLGVALGAAIAHSAGVHLDPGRYLSAQATVTAFQLMTHYGNEYFDRHGDALGTPSAFAGGSGILPAGVLPPRVALFASLVCAAAGSAIALCWLVQGDATAALLALSIGAGAWFYSAPPLRFLATGAGEIETALVVGTLVPLAAYAALAGSVDARAVIATLPAFAAMFVLMLCVEFPDLDADRRCGKRNLVVRFGREGARRLIYVGIVVMFAALTIAFRREGSNAFAVASALIAIGAAVLARTLTARSADEPLGGRRISVAGVGLFSLTTALTAAAYAIAAR